MERKQPVSDRTSDLPLERPVTLPLDHGGRQVVVEIVNTE